MTSKLQTLAELLIVADNEVIRFGLSQLLVTHYHEGVWPQGGQYAYWSNHDYNHLEN